LQLTVSKMLALSIDTGNQMCNKAGNVRMKVTLRYICVIMAAVEGSNYYML
jgi:hypothetical protein